MVWLRMSLSGNDTANLAEIASLYRVLPNERVIRAIGKTGTNIAKTPALVLLSP